jgi:hypothetical protein
MSNLIINPASIAARTKITILKTGAWRAQTTNARETRDVNARNGSGNAATVKVKLLDGGTLESIIANHAAAYAAHRRLTMPTVQDGMRMVSAGLEMQHVAEMQAFADTHARLVSDFLTEYDALKADAPRALGALYDAANWPDGCRVAEKFHFSTRYLATPCEGQWADWLAETAIAAAADFREQLREALQRVADRCGNGGKLYDTVFTNLRDLVALSTDLNIASDPFIARIATLAAPVAGHDADTLRDDKAARKAVAETANSILSYFGKA